MNITALLLFVSTLTAGVGRPPFQALAQAIVKAMRATGKQASRQAPSGPLFLDMASFDAAAKTLGEAPVDRSKLMEGIGTDAKPVIRANAIIQTQTNGRHRAEVLSDGMFITVLSATPTADGVQIIAQVEWTDRRPSGAAAIGAHRMRLMFVPVNDQWVLQKSEILMET